MATLTVNGHVRIGSFQDGAALFNRLQKPRLAVPIPPPSQPDPDQLQYEKELLAHQLKLAKSQISELQQQLSAPPAPLAPNPQPQLPATLSATLSDAPSYPTQAPSPTSPGPAPARLAPTGYPPTTLPAPTTNPILIRRTPSHSLLPNLASAPNPSSVSSSVSGYLSQLTHAHPLSPHHSSSSNVLPALPRSSSFINSLPTSPTAPARPSNRSIPASPHHAPLTAFMHPSPSLRSLHTLERSSHGLGTGYFRHHGDDTRSLTSDEARSRSDLLCDPLDMFASEELGLGSVQEDVQVESLQAEVDRLKAQVDLEDAEKVHLQRRVAELEDNNHSLRRQVELLHQKLSKLGVGGLDVSARDQ